MYYSSLSRYLLCVQSFDHLRRGFNSIAWSTLRSDKVVLKFPNISTVKMPIKQQNYDYFLVLDFEATCDSLTKPEPQEIIEFPVLKVCGKTFQTEAIFHQYVKPTVHTQLTDFCTELTGIIQDMVNGQPDLTETLKNLDQWMHDNGLLQPDVKSIFVTMGDWDLKTMLRSQCSHFNIEIPPYLRHWINLKKPFCDVTGEFPKGMMPMLFKLGLSHNGRHHSGIDDCKNIAVILKNLAQQGYVFKQTGKF